jgi:hypothetical protein
MTEKPVNITLEKTVKLRLDKRFNTGLQKKTFRRLARAVTENFVEDIKFIEEDGQKHKCMIFEYDTVENAQKFCKILQDISAKPTSVKHLLTQEQVEGAIITMTDASGNELPVYNKEGVLQKDYFRSNPKITISQEVRTPSFVLDNVQNHEIDENYSKVQKTE